MKTRTVSPEVLYTTEEVTRVARTDIEGLAEKSRSTIRGRIRLCTHRDVSDGVHEMLIVHPAGAYVRPHLHRSKEESLHLVQGRATAILFDEEGQITETLPLGDLGSGLTFYYRMPASTYHTLLIETDPFVFHETTAGPFRPEDTLFAPWAPDGLDEAESSAFQTDLWRRIGRS